MACAIAGAALRPFRDTRPLLHEIAYHWEFVWQLPARIRQALNEKSAMGAFLRVGKQRGPIARSHSVKRAVKRGPAHADKGVRHQRGCRDWTCQSKWSRARP